MLPSSTKGPSLSVSTRDLIYTALMSSLMVICAWITIPLGPIPFTMQTFAVGTACTLLGGRRGLHSILLYLLLGLIGLPVFSGGNSGPSALMGPTGGYLLGFLCIGCIYWLITESLGASLPVMVLALFLGLFACYTLGTIWFMTVYAGGPGDSISVFSTLTLCVFPYVIPDCIKLTLAVLLSRRIGCMIK